MANFSALKTSIQTAIRNNGNQEITGNLLQEILMSMVVTMGDGAINTNEVDIRALETALAILRNRLGNGYFLGGIATHETVPETPGRLFYIAFEQGEYPRFLANGDIPIVLPKDGFYILYTTGEVNDWYYDNLFTVDDKPTIASEALVRSNGVLRFGVDVVDDKIILENYTENQVNNQHNVVPYPGQDLLLIPIGYNTTFLSVTGPTPDGNNIRYAFWTTDEIDDLVNSNCISSRPYIGSQDVSIPSGTKAVTLHLRRSQFPDGYGSVSVKQKTDAEIKSGIDNNAVPYLLETVAPASVTDGKLMSADGIEHSVQYGRIYEYNISGLGKDLFLSGFLSQSVGYIAFALYYNGTTLIGIDNHLHNPGVSDTRLDRVKLNIPDGATRMLVNGSTIFANNNKLERATDYVDLNPALYSSAMKNGMFKGTIVLTQDDFAYRYGYYINASNGNVISSSNAKYSYPIRMSKGDIITVDTIGTGMAVISITDKVGTSFTPITNFAVGYSRYSYVATDDCYVAICGRKDLLATMTRLDPAIKALLPGVDEITPLTLANKWIDKDGNLTDSTSGNWNVYEYDNIDENDIFLFSGGSSTNGTSGIIYFYDSNGNCINHLLEGSNNRAYTWEKVFVTIPKGTVTIKVNVHINHATKLFKVSVTDLINPSESDGDDSGLPAYYKTYMQQRNEAVIEAFLYSQPRATSFCFATDLHYPINKNLGKIVADILNKTPMSSFVCGGDIPNASINYGDDVTPAEALKMTLVDFDRDMAFARGTGKPVLIIRGNHDFAINRQYGAGSTDAVYIDWKAARNIIMNNNHDIVTNYADDKACYFYQDHLADKRRYIFLDTTDSNGNDGQNSKSPAVSNTQMTWIIQHAVLECPEDFQIIFVSHIYIQRILGTADRYTDYENFANLRKLMDAIQNKKSVTINSVTYDFTDFEPEILCHIAGHNHRDTVVFIDGFWSFTTAANYRSNELPKSPIYQQFPLTTPYVLNGEGTVYENLVDAVVVDGLQSVKTFRFGAGYDRKFTQGQIDVSVGATQQLVSSIDANDIQWWCHDSIGRTTSDGVMTYYNNFATINSSGVLTAIAQGFVTVAAFSRSKNLVEYIGVKVV